MTTTVERAAAYLHDAMHRREALVELPSSCRPRDAAEAYAVQDHLVAMIGAPAGYKVAFTNRGIQRQMGVAEPASGRLIAGRMLASPARIDVSRLFRVGVESEFAFRMGRDLPAAAAPFTRRAVSEAVGALVPAIEIVDTRYADWSGVGALQAIADNAFASHWVGGAAIADWREIDLAAAAVTARLNGAEAAGGSGAEVLGHPLEALTWLANHLVSRGLGLRAGEVVTTGSATAIVMARPGDAAVADFGPLGSVEVALSGSWPAA